MIGYAYAGLAGLELASGFFAAQNIRETAALNQEIADMNAEFAELDAYEALLSGEGQAAKYQAVIDKTLGEQQAAFTAADVDVTYGSAAEIQKETRFIGQLNKMEIEKQAQEQALGYIRQARDYRLGNFLNRAQSEGRASQAVVQGLTSAASTGLTGYAVTQKGTKNGSGYNT